MQSIFEFLVFCNEGIKIDSSRGLKEMQVFIMVLLIYQKNTRNKNGANGIFKYGIIKMSEAGKVRRACFDENRKCVYKKEQLDIMSYLIAQAIEAKVSELFEQNKEGIIREIARGIEETDRIEKVYSKMLYNSMVISTGSSVKIVMDMLTELKIISPLDENQIRKNIMSIIK